MRDAPARPPAADDRGSRVGSAAVLRSPASSVPRDSSAILIDRHTTRRRPRRLSAAAACRASGEISLAHQGVLFLDELPEFDAACSKRCASRSKVVASIFRARRSRPGTPAQFQLIAAMNPCPCGHHGGTGDNANRCRCSPDQVARYRSKLSVRCSTVSICKLRCRRCRQALQGAAEVIGSATVRQRVSAARARQHARQNKANARLSPEGDRRALPARRPAPRC